MAPTGLVACLTPDGLICPGEIGTYVCSYIRLEPAGVRTDGLTLTRAGLLLNIARVYCSGGQLSCFFLEKMCDGASMKN